MISGTNSRSSAIDEVLRLRVGHRHRLSRSTSSDFTLAASTRRKERFRLLAVLLLVAIEAEQPIEDLRHAARRHLGADPAELGAVLVDAAAEHHEVLRHRLVADLADAALEA
jgi:hypothetical protein